MQKIFFTFLFIYSFSYAMNPEKWLVERRDGEKLTNEQIQKIALINNARGCPETNWIEILREKEKKICLDKLNTGKALLIIITDPQQLKRLKRLSDLQETLFEKQNNKTNIFLNFWKKWNK